LGIRAALGVGLGAAFPTAAEALGARIARSSPLADRARSNEPDAGARIGLEVTYGALVVHRFGDGLSMGAVGSNTFVVLAIAAHIVPVTTVMLLAVERLLGKRAATLRGVLLAIATMAGVVVSSLVAALDETALSPWISAAVAGLLVHVVVHDLPGR